MKVVVVGGSGNFGARIVRALRDDSSISLLSAGRRLTRVPGAEEVESVALDITADSLTEDLARMGPGLIVHCAGPFQGQDYGLARACLAVGAHYVDLADGRQFVAGFPAAVHADAHAASRVAITGASTLPALSSAVVDEMMRGLASLERIDVVIAPGQRAPRGSATLAAVFSYLGRPFSVWTDGGWRRVWGWMDLRRVALDVGARWGAACDVPDLALFPARYPGVRTVRFHAALEVGVEHLALWVLAAIRRTGLPLPVDRWGVWLNRYANALDRFAGEAGGMAVEIVGRREDGARVRRNWQLVAPAIRGPEIPSMPAILLARRLARGESMESGAFPCTGLLSLAEFAPEFARWGITTRIVESLP